MLRLRKKISHHIHAKKHAYMYGLFGVTAFFIILGGVFAVTRGAVPQSSELAFTEHSILGVGAGSVIPASCESDPYLVANGDGNYTGCAVPTCSPTHYNCAFGALGTIADTPTDYQWWCNGADPAANVLCSEKRAVVKVVFSPVTPFVDFTTFAGDGNYVWTGTAINVSWNVSGSGTTCVKSGSGWTAGPVGASGVLATSHSTSWYSRTWSYTLTCTNSFETKAKTIYLTWEGDGGAATCFIAGTKVRMGDGSLENIEEPTVGDMIMTSTGPNRITKLFHLPYKGDLYAFNGSGNYFVTPSHAFRTPEGWKSFDPAGTRREVPGLKVSLLKVGDKLLREGGGFTLLESFDKKYSETMVYSFAVDGTRDYYADEYWVHNAKAIIP